MMAQKNIKRAKVLIAAGGTGGHLFPGIAIADEIRRAHPDADILFAGTARGFESKILPGLGWPMVKIGSKSAGEHTLIATVAKWARLPFTALHALYILMFSIRPRLLISIGGQGAAPLAIAAWIARVPLVLVEPNAIAGYTNRKLGRMCAMALVQFDESKAYFPDGKSMVTGMPVRAEVSSICKKTASPDGRVTIFVFGGSQGAVRINRAIVGALEHMGDLSRKITIIHQTGRNDDDEAIKSAYAKAGIKAQVFPFTERIWECYAEADLVVARAGGITIAETSAIGLPLILVPYPYAADDHQRANAEAIARLGGAVVVMDKDCTGERMAREIGSLVDHTERLKAIGAAVSRFGKRDAAKRIVEECWKLVGA